LTTFGLQLIQGQIWLRKLKKAKLKRSKLELNIRRFTGVNVAMGKPRFALLFFRLNHSYFVTGSVNK
jgi:hypothetical protein